MAARFILPWFGGGPAVWSRCLLFFQVALLAGYAYAHVTRRLSLVRPGAAAPRPPGARDADAADRAVGRVGRAGDRRARRCASCCCCRHGRRALRRPRRDRAAAAGLVRAQRHGGRAVPALRAVEPRVAPRAARLPGRHRAVPAAAAQSLGWSALFVLFAACVRRRDAASGSRRAAHTVPVPRTQEPADAPGVPGRSRDVAPVVGLRIGTAARRDEPVVSRPRGRSAPLDRAADVLPADVHRLFLRLVPALDVDPDPARGASARRDGSCARARWRSLWEAVGAGRRAHRRLHGQPRRARAHPSAGEPADVLLPGDRRRRQSRRPERRVSRAGGAAASVGVSVLRRPAARAAAGRAVPRPGVTPVARRASPRLGGPAVSSSAAAVFGVAKSPIPEYAGEIARARNFYGIITVSDDGREIRCGCAVCSTAASCTARSFSIPCAGRWRRRTTARGRGVDVAIRSTRIARPAAAAHRRRRARRRHGGGAGASAATTCGSSRSIRWRSSSRGSISTYLADSRAGGGRGDRRCAAVDRARAAGRHRRPRLRRPGDRRVLGRRDPGAPAHARGVRALRARRWRRTASSPSTSATSTSICGRSCAGWGRSWGSRSWRSRTPSRPSTWDSTAPPGCWCGSEPPSWTRPRRFAQPEAPGDPVRRVDRRVQQSARGDETVTLAIDDCRLQIGDSRTAD